MATLSFSVFLEKILDGSKTQTIREYKPYWKCPNCGWKGPEGKAIIVEIYLADDHFNHIKYQEKDRKQKSKICPKCYKKRVLDKNIKLEQTTRLEVGNTIDIYWKQRTPKEKKESILYTQEGNIGIRHPKDINLWKFIEPLSTTDRLPGNCISAHKLFQVEITEAFVIVMDSDSITCDAYEKGLKNLDDFAKRDGFENSEELFKWFNKHYDLSLPKHFVVYRFKKKEASHE